MAFFVREMAVRVRGIVDHECGFDKTSEEIYQDLCVDRTPLEVFQRFFIMLSRMKFLGCFSNLFVIRQKLCHYKTQFLILVYI